MINETQRRLLKAPFASYFGIFKTQVTNVTQYYGAYMYLPQSVSGYGNFKCQKIYAKFLAATKNLKCPKNGENLLISMKL